MDRTKQLFGQFHVSAPVAPRALQAEASLAVTGKALETGSVVLQGLFPGALVRVEASPMAHLTEITPIQAGELKIGNAITLTEQKPTALVEGWNYSLMTREQAYAQIQGERPVVDEFGFRCITADGRVQTMGAIMPEKAFDQKYVVVAFRPEAPSAKFILG